MEITTIKQNSKFNSTKPLIFLIIFSSMLFFLQNIFPRVIYRFFAYPAADIVSLFFNSPVLKTKENLLLIAVLGKPIQITQTCSGYGFFCVLFSFLLFTLPFKKNAKYLITILPLVILSSYLITLAANSLRIIAAYHLSEMARGILPGFFNSSLHQGVGIITFLTVLFFVAILLKRRFSHV